MPAGSLHAGEESCGTGTLFAFGVALPAGFEFPLNGGAVLFDLARLLLERALGFSAIWIARLNRILWRVAHGRLRRYQSQRANEALASSLVPRCAPSKLRAWNPHFCCFHCEKGLVSGTNASSWHYA